MRFKKNIVVLLAISLMLICGVCGLVKITHKTHSATLRVNADTIGLKPAKITPKTPDTTSRVNTDTLGSKSLKIGLYPAYSTVNGEQLWGYIDQSSKFALKPQFDTASDFTRNGVAIVGQNDGFGIINRTGEFIVKHINSDPFEFQEGYAVAYDSKNDKSYVYNDKGQLQFSYPGYLNNFNDGLARALDNKSNLYGFIDCTGKFKILPQYQFADDFKNGMAYVSSKNNESYWIDKNGKIISPPTEDSDDYYVDPDVFNDGMRITTKETSDSTFYGLNDKDGKVILSCDYSVISRINDSLFEAGKVEYVWPCIPKALFDKSGKRLSDFIYYDIEDTGDKLIVSDQYSTYYLNYDGTKTKGFPIIKGADSFETIDNLLKVISDNYQNIAYYSKDGKVFWQPNKTNKLTKGIKITENTYFQDRYNVTNYPQLEGYKNKVIQNSINKKLKKAFCVKNDGGNLPEESFMSEQNFDDYIYTLNKNLLVINESCYFNGFGAHGSMAYYSYLIDLTTGKFYSLSDLFKTGSDYKDVLEAIIADQIKTVKTEADDHNPNVDDSIFFIDDKGNLQILYNEGEIGCYAAGAITFDIPYKKIIKLIDTKGSFWNSFNKKMPSAASSYSGEPGDISVDMVKGIINQYEDNITSAIGCNEFSYVKSCLYPGSALYDDQKNLVKNLSKKNTYENCVSADVLKINKINNSTVKAYVHEVISISKGDAKSKDNAFDWVYTMKFSNENGRYMLSNIEKWNR